MARIEVDFEVFKAITALRENESMSENDVIRNLLGLDHGKEDPVDESLKPLLDGWSVKNVLFPLQTQFRAQYKGQIHYGIVSKQGLVVDGESFKSPSQAATKITKNSVNGWIFWECKFPGTTQWVSISSLRRE
ncbi:DUF2924 domain-containing protein [Vibrio metoecus]|uniref:restriction system modified-DNA reader domain-containing protein n=1 Tax=Vibrio metoecus TaxID=1481663 RepID=UPI0006D76890|nr:DUF2924 domain-containing protein [Vibrio metoecus]EHP5031040.1 DUF2924 domain-containing protein [Vibrio cholerae]KQA96603.1 hypothetical protein XV91_17630 [Vibrio metoecus]PAR52239.1 DUF2924 domain-containing protein [Vibrio metoecus]PAR59816.1 DUF2924 domain-containing protein [Vibrio metoecus]